MNWNILVLVFGAILLAFLAYVFRDSTLAVIPLISTGLFVVLWPVYEKLRTLVRIGAEFSPTKASVVVEASSSRIESSESVQAQVATQVQQSQNELAQAVDQTLSTSTGVSQVVRDQIRKMIEEYSLVAQRHAAAAIDLLLERLIFEYLLRGPAYWTAVINHLTYVFFGRTDLVANQNTATYVNQIAARMAANNQIAFTQIGGRSCQ